MALFTFVRRLASAFYLIRHPAVPLRLKVLPAIAFIYLFIPRDVFPDWIRIVGLVDDVLVITVLFGIFTSLAWKHVLAEQKRKDDSIDADFEVLGRVDRDDQSPHDDIRGS